MKNINYFESFIAEYYHGKNSTIGFRYSEPKLKTTLTIIILGPDDIEDKLNSKLKDLVDPYSLNLEKIDGELSNLPELPEEIKALIKIDYMSYNINIDLVTYDELEIYSLLFELSKNADDFILLPLAFLNGKSFDITQIYKSKNKIGY